MYTVEEEDMEGREGEEERKNEEWVERILLL